MVGLVCAFVGLLIGWLLNKPVNGKTFSAYHAFDGCAALLPSYLLAIAIVAFLGPGLEGMIAIGVVGIPVYAAWHAGGALCQSEGVRAASQSVGEGHAVSCSNM